MLVDNIPQIDALNLSNSAPIIQFIANLIIMTSKTEKIQEVFSRFITNSNNMTTGHINVLLIISSSLELSFDNQTLS
jgi:hypothetical protein